MKSLCECAFWASAFMCRRTGFHDCFRALHTKRVAIKRALKIQPGRFMTNQGLDFVSEV